MKGFFQKKSKYIQNRMTYQVQGFLATALKAKNIHPERSVDSSNLHL